MSGAKVARLALVERKVNEALVDLLRDMLAQAESGDLVAFIGAGQLLAGETVTARAMDDPRTDAARLLFAVETAKFRMMATLNLENA